MIEGNPEGATGSSQPPKRTKATAEPQRRVETHPWLKWPGCSAEQKVILNRELAAIQNKGICAPRFMDWNVTRRLGINEQLDSLFLTKSAEEVDVQMWKRVFDLRENVYREWVLEFYSSLEINRDFDIAEMATTKVIKFRLGGREHNVTIQEFGFLAGILTKEEYIRMSKDDSFLFDGELDAGDFVEKTDDVWFSLSGIDKHGGSSKIKEVRVPLLRLVHKMLTYSFIHRSTQHDKVYVGDLWLLDKFHVGDPRVYINVPWALVLYMACRAIGTKENGQICCGHFVTKIAKNLKLDTPANIRACSPPVAYKLITMRDLEISKLVNEEKTGLVGDTIGPIEEEVPPGPRRSMQERLFEVMLRLEEKIDCLGNEISYHVDRYQPVLEKMLVTDASARNARIPRYAPPPRYEADEEEEAVGGDEDEV